MGCVFCLVYISRIGEFSNFFELISCLPIIKYERTPRKGGGGGGGCSSVSLDLINT